MLAVRCGFEKYDKKNLDPGMHPSQGFDITEVYDPNWRENYKKTYKEETFGAEVPELSWRDHKDILEGKHPHYTVEDRSEIGKMLSKETVKQLTWLKEEAVKDGKMKPGDKFGFKMRGEDGNYTEF